MVEKKKVTIDRATLVVKELPTQDIRIVADVEGNETDILTSEEALKEILDTVRDIKKALG